VIALVDMNSRVYVNLMSRITESKLPLKLPDKSDSDSDYNTISSQDLGLTDDSDSDTEAHEIEILITAPTPEPLQLSVTNSGSSTGHGGPLKRSNAVKMQIPIQRVETPDDLSIEQESLHTTATSTPNTNALQQHASVFHKVGRDAAIDAFYGRHGTLNNASQDEYGDPPDGYPGFGLQGFPDRFMTTSNAAVLFEALIDVAHGRSVPWIKTELGLTNTSDSHEQRKFYRAFAKGVRAGFTEIAQLPRFVITVEAAKADKAAGYKARRFDDLYARKDRIAAEFLKK
jgi:hypothetical protein